MPADLYDVLGTSNDAAAETIKRAYRERVREYHPDVNDHPNGDEQFKLIRTANDVLSDPAERKDYDRLGHREYVAQNYEDLPPVSVFPDDALPDGARTTEPTDSGTAGSRSSATDATSTDRTATSSRPTGTASSEQGSGSAGSTTTNSSRDRNASATTAAEATPTGGGSAGADTNAGSTSAGTDRSSWDAATNSTRSRSDDSTVPAGVRRRRGLKRGYVVVLFAVGLYAAGLGLYARTQLAALWEVVGDVTAAPVPTLLAPLPVESPAAYVLDAARASMAGTPTLGLVLLAGAVLLPLVVLTTVGRFGRGAAWMYAVPSIAPAVCLAAWVSVAVPAWGALLGLVVFPFLSGGGFLFDVGRYLRATR
ncbi:MAG: DnaJ domain-containing protein [archaeon]